MRALLQSRVFRGMNGAEGKMMMMMMSRRSIRTATIMHSREPSALDIATPSCFTSLQTRCFSKKAKNKGAGNAPAHRPAPHHQHSPSYGGHAPGVDEPLVDMKGIKNKMERIMQALEREFAGVRGGKADAGMFDHLNVMAYGKPTPMADVGQVTLKSPTMAMINVYDPELLDGVSIAIKESKLDLMPRIEGNAVAIPLPKPSAEMRESLVKLVSQHTEKAKQNIRKVRREGLDGLKKEKDAVSEDEIRRESKVIEAMTDELVKKAGDMLEKKRKEIMTV